MNALCNSIQTILATDLDELFQNHILNETVCQAFKKLGENKARLLMDQVTRENFEKPSIFRTINMHCTRLFGAISNGIAESSRKIGKAGGKASTSKIISILGYLPQILKYSNVVLQLHSIKESSKTFLESANTCIQQTLFTASIEEVSANSEVNVRLLADRQMQHWKQILIETSNQAIADQLIAPLLSYGVNKLVGFIGRTIKEEYRSWKKDEHRKQFESLKKNYDAKVRDDKLNAKQHQKEQKAYHEALIKLLAKTRDATLFADIIRENVPMDMTCVQACTNTIHRFILEFNIMNDKNPFSGIRITVDGADSLSYEYSSSSDPSHTIPLTLENNHFSAAGNESMKASTNNCLYEALIDKIPELKTVFRNGVAFREYLSNYIEHDESLRYTISQGWHEFAIKSGSYGGEVDENKYNKDTIYRKLVTEGQKTFKKIIKEDRSLSKERRNYIQKHLDIIENIVKEDSTFEDTAEKVKEAMTELEKLLDKNSSSDEALRKQVSSYRKRISLTKSKVFKKVLKEFLSKAKMADQQPSNPKAVHINCRKNFAQDDIDVKPSKDKGISAHKDPNFLASFIHGQLNKELPQEDRRFNTVAVGIHHKTIFVAMNHVEAVNGKQSYGTVKDKCKTLCQRLRDEKLLSGYDKVVFIEGKFKPETQAECRAPHAEMQIMQYWMRIGILKQDSTIENHKRLKIGASKSPCLCCALVMKTHKVDHKIFAYANMGPKNWHRISRIHTKPQYRWKQRKNST